MGEISLYYVIYTTEIRAETDLHFQITLLK